MSANPTSLFVGSLNAMKHSFSLKTVSALGVMAALSVAIYSNVKQPTQAQAQSGVVVESPSESDCTAAIGYEDESFDQFQGIDFTPEQEAAYRQIGKKMSEEAALSIQDVERDMANAALTFIVKDGVILPDSMLQEIFSANDTVASDQVPDNEQIGELNAKYGQYVEFSLTGGLLFTPEQLAERQEGVREFEAAMLSIFTPEQQQIYLRNIETKRAIDACDVDS